MGYGREQELRRDFILASAFFHARDLKHASSARVLRHAMIAAGVWEERFGDAFDGDHDEFPVVWAWYATLVDLTRDDISRRHLDGAGNLDLPAGALFTGCCLTPAGRAAAERLLADHPDWGERLTADE